MVYGDSMVTMPCNIALGLLMPIHSHVGLNYIVSDYVPQAARGEISPPPTHAHIIITTLNIHPSLCDIPHCVVIANMNIYAL